MNTLKALIRKSRLSQLAIAHNVAHNEIDLANPQSNHKTAGFTKEEREGFTKFLSYGFIDTFRELYPDQTGAYTFWSYMRK